MKKSTLFSKATFAALIAAAMAATPLKTQAITIVNSFEIDLSLTTITNDSSGGQLILGRAVQRSLHESI